jgi:tetratricopeptide (TPR) repeat protein
MSESHRRDAHAGSESEAVSEADRDAKIEQLLLVGLDQYFAAQYEQAINVWTRVLFLDRGHQRARAYIERARSALAERQRESEELLQHGVAAFHRGEGSEARRLLQAAIDGGAPAEEALALLDRLNRLEAPAAVDAAARVRSEPRTEPVDVHEHAPWSRFGVAVAMAIALGALALGGYAAASSNRVDWRALLQLSDPPASPPSATVSQDLSLPLPSRGELSMARARALAASGHLHEALAALDGVLATDAQRPEADRLRADLQRQLLALAALPSASSRERDQGERGVP